MENIRNFFANVKNDYLVNKTTAGENRVASGIKIGICLLLYFAALFLQIRLSTLTNIAGVIAQIQVMVSVYLVVAVKNKGYQIAVGINILVSVIIAIIIVFLTGNMDAIPGVVVPLCTIITISIISFYEKSFETKLTEVTEQKKELSTHYDELASKEKEI